MPRCGFVFTPRAKEIVELSMQEALLLGDLYAGPEHVLLGLAQENDGVQRGSCSISAWTPRRSEKRR
jgi:Clp amino terminal domain, pathogenicity island component